MNDQERRIKLAEAMGWTIRDNGWAVAPNGKLWPLADIPDPFTDANDDYAVLEWMRCRGRKYWTPFMHDTETEQWAYKIGDYARAALKVIE